MDDCPACGKPLDNCYAKLVGMCLAPGLEIAPEPVRAPESIEQYAMLPKRNGGHADCFDGMSDAEINARWPHPIVNRDLGDEQP